jgi:hypothetical protein
VGLGIWGLFLEKLVFSESAPLYGRNKSPVSVVKIKVLVVKIKVLVVKTTSRKNKYSVSVVKTTS